MKTGVFFGVLISLWTCDSTPVLGQLTVQQLTHDSGDKTWGVRNSATSQGQVLWVYADDSVIFFDGAKTNLVQRRDSLGSVDNVVFTLGSGATSNQPIAVWRRGTDSGWISLGGGTPVPVNVTNPIDPANGLNAEGVAVADGSVFMILQAGTFKHVFQIDPATGLGTNLTGNAMVPGAQGRISTSRGQAVWPFQDNTNNISRLYFYNGASVQILETNIDGNPQIADGRIVYLKQVDGMDQVFLYDATAASPAPVQLTSDLAGTNAFPRTDGRHVAWLHTFPNATNPVIMLNGDVQLTSADNAPPNQTGDFRDRPFQLDRGQLLWEDTQGRLQYCPGTAPLVLDLSPGISFGSTGGTPCCIPWLQDGFVAWTGLSMNDTSNHQVFLLTARPPIDGEQPSPPLVLQSAATGGAVTLSWDQVAGASSYSLYLANSPALNQANYASLAGGRKISAVTSPYTIQGLTNRLYFFAISSVEQGVEGPLSPLTAMAVWSAADAPLTNYHAIAAGLTNGAAAYAAGGLALYRSTNGGAAWNLLAGGSQGLDVRALAVDGPRVYAATQDKFNVGPAQILRSVDSGATWTVVVPDAGQLGEQNRVIALDPLDPSHLYAADFRLPTMNIPGDSYVVSSRDGGDHWFHLPQAATPLGAEIHAYALAIDPSNPAVVYAGGTGTPNLVRSSDYGTNWTDVNVGPGYVYSLAIHPVQSSNLYAGVVDSVQGSRGVLRSMNGGATWAPCNTGFPSPLPRVYSLWIDPVNPQLIHAGTDGGHFFSIDAGAQWLNGNSSFPAGGAPYISALALTDSRQLLAATTAGIYRLNLANPSPVTIPKLAIVATGASAMLYWPATADGFFLQSATHLDPGASWINVTNLVVLTNALKAATVELTNSACFFRLVHF